MYYLESILSPIPLPKIVKVRQCFDDAHIEDINGYLTAKIKYNHSYQTKVKPGMRIAITAGSRGINGITSVLLTVINALKEKGAVPFIVPAMGSHAGATAGGQKAMLDSLGINENSMGVPIKSSMEVDKIGATLDGRAIYIDRYAHKADGIIVINRVKAHTTFHGKYESGLMKMMTIGLGKQLGAQGYHKTGYQDLPKIIDFVGNYIIKNQNIIFGVAITENANGKINRLEVIDSNNIPSREEELLALSKKNLPKLFARKLDVLCIQEIGKDISGTGVDSNIVGRYNVDVKLSDDDLYARRICMLDLSDESRGAAAGMGFGDIITKRLYDKFIPEQVYPNVLTSTGVRMGMIPIVIETDMLAIKAAVKTSSVMNELRSRIIFINNTKHIEYIYISESLLAEAKTAGLQILSEPFPIPFNQTGDLLLKYCQ